ncbi:intermediate transcription factor VITF-3 [Nile crocodilepox virus]|uniref:Intermediate transcription factor 3 small subunit n=1 Tax=Nile crocodilepox virus (isolate Crocodylus niloticus/Zimbabwe/Ume/2001) TaxID=1289473 RepID=Q070C2_CPRVZ|nr:intermediate transcription factor VITF-3 [Nile crocodilepox virus]ABJ09020.1 intermediate transcription factor VITF-3 [Nile crocodilepox virus]
MSYEAIDEFRSDSTLEIGDVELGSINPREAVQTYVSYKRRIFVSKTRDEERKLSFGFFTPRFVFLNYKEINHCFQYLDSIKEVKLSKKNNVIVPVYVVFVLLDERGFKFIESLIGIYFPELIGERSKTFRFRNQIAAIRARLGLPPAEYCTYEFERYYAALCLVLQRYADLRPVAVFSVEALRHVADFFALVTYRVFLLQIKAGAAVLSVSVGAVVNKLVGSVLYAVFEMLRYCRERGCELECELGGESAPAALSDLRGRLFPAYERLVGELRAHRRVRANDILLSRLKIRR